MDGSSSLGLSGPGWSSAPRVRDIKLWSCDVVMKIVLFELGKTRRVDGRVVVSLAESTGFTLHVEEACVWNLKIGD